MAPCKAEIVRVTARIVTLEPKAVVFEPTPETVEKFRDLLNHHEVAPQQQDEFINAIKYIQTDVEDLEVIGEDGTGKVSSRRAEEVKDSIIELFRLTLNITSNERQVLIGDV